MSTEIIDLKNNRLTELSPSFIEPLLPTLRKLFVNNNRIKRFSQKMLSIFNRIDVSIRIQDNPLVCDCESRWLKLFYDTNIAKISLSNDRGATTPRCSEPLLVSGKTFQELELQHFICDKPSLDSEVSFSKHKGLLKCISKGHPSPTISWYRPNGEIEETFPTGEGVVTVAQVEVLPSQAQAHGSYKCVASNAAGNVSMSINMTWPFLTSDRQPCIESTTAKEVIITNGDSAGKSSDQDQEIDVFKRKYFTIIDIIIAVFGTFAGTLVVTVIVLHLCVYRRRKSSQYSTPPQSEYSASSIKNEVYPPSTQQHMHIRPMPMPHMQNRPLPNEPYHKAYDENHYMSTQLAGDTDDLARLGQHNAGAQMSPHTPCQACQTINAQHRHSQQVS